MAIVKLQVPIYMPAWLRPHARRWKHAVLRNAPSPINIWGDRDVENSFIAAHLPEGPGEALDFGNGGTYLGLMAALRGFRVTALDLQQQLFNWQHPEVRFVQGDLFLVDFPLCSFDLIINCSAVEHVGLVGRYDVDQGRKDGDLEAMARMRELMKPGAPMLLTVPVGQDAVFAPMHRVYGEARLPLLLKGFEVGREQYWVKDAGNRWVPSDRRAALAFRPGVQAGDPGRMFFALGCFVLRR